MQTILIEIRFPWKFGTYFGLDFLGTLLSDGINTHQLHSMLYEFSNHNENNILRLGAAIGFSFRF